MTMDEEERSKKLEMLSDRQYRLFDGDYDHEEEQAELREIHEELVRIQKDRIGEMSKEEFDEFDAECNRVLSSEDVIKVARQMGKTRLTTQYLQLRLAEKEALGRFKEENKERKRT